MTAKSSGKVSRKTRRSASKLPVIAVLGYGGQGRALALNWRDSGYPVIVALRPRSRHRQSAKAEGLPVVSFREAAILAEVIVFAVPDHVHGRLYERWFAASIRTGTTLLFLHGTSIAFGGVRPVKAQPCGLLAPHAPGTAVRSQFLAGLPLSGFVGANRPATLSLIRELAAAAGIPRGYQMKTTFRQEAIGDLFGEQMVLCGGLAALVGTGFETLVKAGIPPEHAWLEVGYQLDLIVALMKADGVRGMFEKISVAAQHGSAEVFPVLEKALQPLMRRRLNEIADGKYPRRLLRLAAEQNQLLISTRKNISSEQLENAARKIASLTKMPVILRRGRRQMHR